MAKDWLPQDPGDSINGRVIALDPLTIETSEGEQYQLQIGDQPALRPELGHLIYVRYFGPATGPDVTFTMGNSHRAPP